MQMHESSVIAPTSGKLGEQITHDDFIWTHNPLGRSICQHDSGNPLVYENTLIGVASEEFMCYDDYPDIYTKVFDHLEWIKTEMKN